MTMLLTRLRVSPCSASVLALVVRDARTTSVSPSWRMVMVAGDRALEGALGALDRDRCGRRL